MTESQIAMCQECLSFGLTQPVPEYQFFTDRKWKFDYAWPGKKVALEVEGGIFGYKDKEGVKKKSGAHSSVSGMLRDIEKYNAATSVGWKILRVVPYDLIKLKTFELLHKTLSL